MSHTRAVWLFVLALTAIRFTMLGTSDLSFDEAHYWMWSERLAPAYFSKGPGIAFAIRASTAICEIGIPVERSPDSMRIRARSRVTAIANRIASLVVLVFEDLLFTT